MSWWERADKPPRGYSARQQLPENPVPLGGAIIPPKDTITDHIALSIGIPPHLDQTRRGVPMPESNPTKALYQECGRFHHALQLMEIVLQNTLREIQTTSRRWAADQQHLRTPQLESLKRLVGHNLGQCQEYMTDATHAAKQIDAMLSEETEDGGPVGP